MKNLNRFDDFFEFAAQAGEAICALLADEWFTPPDPGQTRDSAEFLRFIGRQKDNMLIIASAAEGVTAEAFKEMYPPAALTDRVGEVMREPNVRDFFGLRGEWSASSSHAGSNVSAEV